MSLMISLVDSGAGIINWNQVDTPIHIFSFLSLSVDKKLLIFSSVSCFQINTSMHLQDITSS